MALSTYTPLDLCADDIQVLQYARPRVGYPKLLLLNVVVIRRQGRVVDEALRRLSEARIEEEHLLVSCTDQVKSLSLSLFTSLPNIIGPIFFCLNLCCFLSQSLSSLLSCSCPV